MGQVLRWQCAVLRNVGESGSVGLRDWHCDDLQEERSLVPPTAAHFDELNPSEFCSSVGMLVAFLGMLCGDSAVSQAFRFLGSSRGCVSFFGPPVTLRIASRRMFCGLFEGTPKQMICSCETLVSERENGTGMISRRRGLSSPQP
ncbi:hypothetical protein AXF42_Ash013355 [Apostasia shenzhenica]|uniref:Uncharacterized protein n=1 Tax=Apostasia shenzhenica TaxID=1088818 RepID=A0A2I0BBQ5_9ASPA|nr:hypothetical protein AXF42_Ash013355 [Apostasia shenzhenica]